MPGESLPDHRSVLMLCNDRQIDRRILLEADSLEENGWQVRILAMPLDEPGIDAPRVIRLGQSGKSNIARGHLILRCYRFVRRHLNMNGGAMRLLKALAWRYVVDQERFYLGLYLDEARRLMPVDVVVAHDLPMLAVARTLASEFSARLVYDSHELYCEQEFSGVERRNWAAIEKKHIAACDLITTVNPSIANELQRRYGLVGVEVIHNAERVEALGPRSRYLHERFGIDHSHFILLFQGGLSAGRNLLELVRAMALMSRDDVHLVILGNGQLAETIESLIKRLHLEKRVFLHEAVAQAELLVITASADAGIIPYQAICLNNYYCTPNKLFEFIAAGIPILASDLPELRRIVDECGIGLVADLSTPELLAARIDEFFSDAEVISQWRHTLLSVREEFNWQTEGSRLQVLYERFK